MMDNTHLVLADDLGYSSEMIADIDTLFAEALALPDDSRLQLVERLIPTIQSEPSLEAEQVQEVQRRMEQVRSGQVKTIPGEQVFREIEQSLAARRNA
jgi:putative addiction module component (TIGR02574 family)